MVDIAILLDIIKKSGSWFAYNGERLGQGKENIRKMLESNTALFEEIEGKIREQGDRLNEKNETFEVEEEDGEEDFDLRTLKLDDESES